MNICILQTYLILSLVSAAPGPPPAAPEGLEAAIDTAVATCGITADTPGVAVGVTIKDKLVFRKGYGLANLADKTPIRPQTTFELASCSKQFTGVAISILHDQGKLSFDDPARKYIPELPDFDANHPIRLRDLLNHTSGLPDYIGWPGIVGRDPNYLDNEDYAKAIKENPSHVALRFTTGEKSEYCNNNYMLLALIVERVSKESYGAFMHDEVFKPLGMKRTWVYDRPKTPPKDKTLGFLNAVGYAKDDKGAWTAAWGSPPFRTERLLTVGDGGIWTCVEDMAHWDAALRDHKLLKRETWNEFLAPSKTTDGKNNYYGFGLGTDRDDKGKLTWFGHGGAWGGFGTGYSRSVKGDYGWIFLANGIDVGPVNTAISDFMAQARSKPKKSKKH